MSKIQVNQLVEIALAATLALVLNMIPHSVANTFYIEFGVLPVLVLSLRRGGQTGCQAGLVFGLLTLITGQAYILSIPQAFLEYILAPLSLGLAGFWRIWSPLFRSLLAILVKYFWHFLAGLIFWGDTVPKGWDPFWFSFLTQVGSGLLTALFASAILALLLKKTPTLFLVK